MIHYFIIAAFPLRVTKPCEESFNYAEIRPDTLDSVTNYVQEYDVTEQQSKASGITVVNMCRC